MDQTENKLINDGWLNWKWNETELNNAAIR